MKVTINGTGVGPDAVCTILKDLESEYGLKIRDLTMYIRFVDENGRTVDPKLPANGDELVMKVETPNRETPEEWVYDEQTQKEFDKIKVEFLSAGIEEDIIKRAFEVTLLNNEMRLPRKYLSFMVKIFASKGIRTREQVQEYLRSNSCKKK